MKNQNLMIRRVDLIFLLIVLIIGFVTACGQIQDDTEVSGEIDKITLPPISTHQATSEPSSTIVSTQSTTPDIINSVVNTSTSIPTPVCVRILSPSDGAIFVELDQIRFEWEPYSEATKYRLEIVIPDGKVQVFETFMTSTNKYLNMLPWGGTYTWRVAALGLDGRELCLAGPFSFTKPESIPSPGAQESGNAEKGPQVEEGRGG